ncbi:FAD-dependent oxidoreductase [Oceanibacterium hippocampi]|uniref:Putative bifunctional glutamate synthase subunit beta/2-polyprenylphenol hydroxylase n=1 Tax=Oceanibacterium hippocampi TaxID=745714 RepID=A0A1Y5SIL6_9PROT|nr:FAD-dependent oxidoreductase [Oceanibacterium hippocampi]SLN38657.1 putative bifunctional glutamate synthase subunit beta/2-polyprenylphenol hydroxylase [Oceanibacterium hippocampi]
MTEPRLGYAVGFRDLYARDGLVRIDEAFLAELAGAAPDLHARLLAARAAPDALDARATSDLLVALAPPLEDFLGTLFGIGAAIAELAGEHKALEPVFRCRRLFVQRRAPKLAQGAAVPDEDALAALLGGPFDERRFAARVLEWMDDEPAHGAALAAAAAYSEWATGSEEGRARHHGSVLFHKPRKTDPEHLVDLVADGSEGFTCFRAPSDHLRRREGFDFDPHDTDLAGALGEAHYCIWCHNQEKDSCSKGLRLKAAEGDEGPRFRQSHFGVPLTGCPLEEKISEMNWLKAEGVPVGALAVVCVDNPLCAATGHRICNDCAKACVYQKQDPVDIPRIETRVLNDVLALPYGFEIYSLLTRWNPLNFARPLPRPESGRRVLVVGLGPAGMNLAHHLLNDGHQVVAVDALKIEPLEPRLSGRNPDGSRTAFEAVREIAGLREPLGKRVAAGFGGLSEYGITIRWDKNFLTVLRLLLERRTRFSMFGSVRFGGVLDADGAFGLGFDHIALSVGAGHPKVLDIPNGLAPGVSTSTDFLMSLQLAGAMRADSLENVPVRLPVLVIGGGLTAIDAATEALAFYPLQVERFYARYEALTEELGEARVRGAWSHGDAALADEMIAHARAIAAERAWAAKEGRAPDILSLLQSWGGSKIVYRKRLIDAPAYTLNHEEVENALGEGIGFAECLSPVAFETDSSGRIAAAMFERQRRDEAGEWHGDGQATLAAGTVVVATGTRANVKLGEEDPEHFPIDGRYFQTIDESGRTVHPEPLPKPRDAAVLLNRYADGRCVSFFGDAHPSFAGNVVRAMASAKKGAPVISRALDEVAPASDLPIEAFVAALRSRLAARLHAIARADGVVLLTVHAPELARRHRPGFRYKLQRLARFAPVENDTRLVRDMTAAVGAGADAEAGRLYLAVADDVAGSLLARTLSPGDMLAVMGPSGEALDPGAGERVLMIGQGFVQAALIGYAGRVAATGGRADYLAFHGTESSPVETALRAEAANAEAVADMAELGRIDFAAYDRVIVAAPVPTLVALQARLAGEGLPGLRPGTPVVAALDAPMQCMIKEVCGRCLQSRVDPESGRRENFFACAEPNQALAAVDFALLAARRDADSVSGRINALWLDHCLNREEAATVA